MELPPVPQKRKGRIMGKLQFPALDSSTKRPNTSSGTAAMTLASVDVVLVGGDRLFRAGLQRLFENTALNLLAEADTTAGLDAVTAVQATPDVLIAIDLEMPETDSDAWHGQFKQQWPSIRVIALITRNDDRAAIAALRNGLDGCLFADMSPQALVHAIQLVAMGVNVFPTRVGRSFAQQSAQPNRPHLTPREHDILQGLLSGHSNKLIANTLGTTDMTVKAQLRHLLRKLNVSNRTQAALWAREQGLERPQDRPDETGPVALPSDDH